MDAIFFNRLAVSNASTNCRNGIFDFVLKHPETLPELIAFSTDLTNKNHHKAVWIIEMLAEHNTAVLIPHINAICKTIADYKHESAFAACRAWRIFLALPKPFRLRRSKKKN